MGNVKVIYNDKKEFIKIARTLSIMEDFKAGVPRGGYKARFHTKVCFQMLVTFLDEMPAYAQPTHLIFACT